jgi:hypothetical protein
MGRRRLFNDKEKWCNKCSKWLPLDAFGDNRRTASGKQDYCKTCHSAYGDGFWGKVETINKTLAEKFGMQPGDYLEQWKSQNKQCAVCSGVLILYQRDTHVHIVGPKKMLLCANCDAGLTAFGDDPKVLQWATILLSSCLSSV